MRYHRSNGGDTSPSSLVPSQRSTPQHQGDDNHSETIEMRPLDPAVLRPESPSIEEMPSPQPLPVVSRKPLPKRSLKRAWNSHIVANVPLEDCRDYLGQFRCYTSWLRLDS